MSNDVKDEEISYKDLWLMLKEKLNYQAKKYMEIGMDALRNSDFINASCAFEEVARNEMIFSFMEKAEKREKKETDVSEA